MLWRVMPFEPLDEPPCFVRREMLAYQQEAGLCVLRLSCTRMIFLAFGK